MKKRYVALAGAVAVTALTVAIGQNQTPVVIAASVSITGGGASLGASEAKVLELLEKRINAQGGLSGHPLKLNVYDDATDPQKAVLNVRKGITEDRAVGIICCTTSPNSMAAIDTVTRSKVPMVSMAAAATIVEPVNQRYWIFKTPPPDRVMARAEMNDMKKRGIKTLAFLGFADSYGEGGLAEVQKYASAAGLTLVATEKFNRTDPDTTAQATRIVNAKPDAVLVWAIPPGANTAQKGLVNAGFKGKIYQSYGVTNPDFLRLGGKDVEGVLTSALPIVIYDQLPKYLRNKGVLDDLVKTYQAAYPKEFPTSFTGHAWDAATIFFEAIRQALADGSDPAKIEDFRADVRNKIEGLRSFKGISGVFNFSRGDHVGLGPSTANMITVKDGEFRLITGR